MRQRDILWFWLPLFASWLLMTAEGPLISAAINRLPNEVIMLAAQGIVISLSVMIESPIINMLSTSTALVRDYQSYAVVRKFTIHWAVILTLITIAIAFTPLFDMVVVGWLEAPAAVAQWVQPGLQIMTLWSAAIAWRRFLQGVLIHFDMTKQVAHGTAVRLLATGGVVTSLALWTEWPGVNIAATALMTGVITEALFATWAVRPLFQTHLSPDTATEGDPLTYRDLFWFHLPLASTSVLILMAQPLVTSSLARLDNPTESLAAWPVLFQMMLVARAAAFALPEVVIALTKGAQSFAPIRRFSLMLTAVTTTAMFLFVFTPASRFYVFTLQDMTDTTGELARSVLSLFLFFPALATITSWFRGLLISQRSTKAVNQGMIINLIIMGVILLIGLQLQWLGLHTAAIALNTASFFETIYLGWRTQRVLPDGLSLLRINPQVKRNWRLETGD